MRLEPVCFGVIGYRTWGIGRIERIINPTFFFFLSDTPYYLMSNISEVCVHIDLDIVRSSPSVLFDDLPAKL